MFETSHNIGVNTLKNGVNNCWYNINPGLSRRGYLAYCNKISLIIEGAFVWILHPACTLDRSVATTHRSPELGNQRTRESFFSKSRQQRSNPPSHTQFQLVQKVD